MLRPAEELVTDRRSSDRGIGLVTTVMVMLVVTVLMGTAFTESLHSVTSSAIARKTTQASSGAESFLNAAIQQVVTGGANGSLPCGTNTSLNSITWPTLNNYGSSNPATIVQYSSASSVITNPATRPTASQVVYYSTTTPSSTSAITTCTGLTGAAESALVTTVATSTPANLGTDVTEQALLQISPAAAPGTALTDAIYGYNGLTLQNGATLSGASPTALSLYSNAKDAANLPCSNGALAGSLIAPEVTQDVWTMTNSCDIQGNIYTDAPISMSTSSATVGGTIYDSWNSASPGYTTGVSANTPSLTVNNSLNTRLGGADVTGWIQIPVGGMGTVDKTAGTCESSFTTGTNQQVFSSSSTCKLGDSTVAGAVSGQYQAFPQLDYYTGTPPSGWTVFNETNCSSALTDLTTVANEGSGKWVFNAGSCNLSFNGNSYTFSNDVMIVTTGSISFTNNGTWKSSSSTAHNVYFVVPYAEGASSSSLTTTACSGSTTGAGTINIGPPPTFTNIDTLWYTPCDFTATNSLTITGEIYSGSTAGFTGSAPTITYMAMTAPLSSSGASSGDAAVTYEWERQL